MKRSISVFSSSCSWKVQWWKNQIQALTRALPGKNGFLFDLKIKRVKKMIKIELLRFSNGGQWEEQKKKRCTDRTSRNEGISNYIQASLHSNYYSSKEKTLVFGFLLASHGLRNPSWTLCRPCPRWFSRSFSIGIPRTYSVSIEQFCLLEFSVFPLENHLVCPDWVSRTNFQEYLRSYLLHIVDHV